MIKNSCHGFSHCHSGGLKSKAPLGLNVQFDVIKRGYYLIEDKDERNWESKVSESNLNGLINLASLYSAIGL